MLLPIGFDSLIQLEQIQVFPILVKFKTTKVVWLSDLTVHYFLNELISFEQSSTLYPSTMINTCRRSEVNNKSFDMIFKTMELECEITINMD